jgi:hypothetical protein
MNKVIAILLLAFIAPANAGIFKCLSATGATEYKTTPCDGKAVQQTVNIKPPSLKTKLQAQQKLQEWQQQEAAKAEAKYQAEKKQQAELAEQRKLNALEKQAQAAQDLATLEAIKEQNRMEEVEQQNRYNNVYIQNPQQRHSGRYRSRHRHENNDGVQPDWQHKQLGDYGVYRPLGSLGYGLGEYRRVPWHPSFPS